MKEFVELVEGLDTTGLYNSLQEDGGVLVLSVDSDVLGEPY